jgi:hypothetical protein
MGVVTLPRRATGSAKAAHSEPTLDHFALGYAQRRAWVFGSWWYGILLASGGATYSLTAVLMGLNPETGVFLAVLGLAIGGVGWIVSSPQRFSRKQPKPSKEIARAEQSIRINPGVVVVSNVAMLVIIVVLLLNRGPDAAPDVIPILAMIGTWPPMCGVGIMFVRTLLIERRERYQAWRAAAPTPV